MTFIISYMPRPIEDRVYNAMLEFKCIRLLRSSDKAIESTSNPPLPTAATTVSHSTSSLSLLDIRLLTGRKHQIRAQLSHLGHPVVGDSVYGYVHRPSHPKAAARFISKSHSHKKCYLVYVLQVRRS